MNAFILFCYESFKQNLEKPQRAEFLILRVNTSVGAANMFFSNQITVMEGEKSLNGNKIPSSDYKCYSSSR